MENTYGLHIQGNYICRETWTYLFLTPIMWVDTLPNFLMDSNVSLNGKQWKSKESGHALWLATLWRGKGACWSFGMGLGRMTIFNYSHKPAQNQHKVVSAYLEHFWC